MKRLVTTIAATATLALGLTFAPQAQAAMTKIMWTGANGAPISGTPSVAAGDTLHFVLGGFPTGHGLYAYEAVQPMAGSRPTLTSASIPVLTMWISADKTAPSHPTEVLAFTIDNGNAWNADCAHQQCGLWFQYDHTNMADHSEDQFVPFNFVAGMGSTTAVPTSAATGLGPDLLTVKVNGTALVQNVPGTIAYRTPLTFDVTTGSGVKTTLKSYTPDLCPVKDNVVDALKGSGICDIAVSSVGDATHGPVTAHFPLMVTPAVQKIKITAATLKVGKSVSLSATTGFGEKVTYKSASKSCSVKGSAVKAISAGTCSVSATAPGTANYSALTTNVVVTVMK